MKESWSGTLWYWETPAGQIRRQRRVEMLTRHILKGMTVLELGCGVGYFTEYLAQSGANIIANDISPDLLEVARNRVTSSNVTFKLENAYELSYRDAEFDAVIGSSVLHHLDIEKALIECHRVLKPGGGISFTEPNILNPQIFLERSFKFIRKLARVSPDETAFSRWQLLGLLEKCHFTNIRIQPFDFLHPLTPEVLIPIVSKFGNVLEKAALLKEISGSLYITAEKKGN
ncbi:MAG: class I SAM-dependent methyltransferase [Candidatus Omnitrophota bacterium]